MKKKSEKRLRDDLKAIFAPMIEIQRARRAVEYVASVQTISATEQAVLLTVKVILDEKLPKAKQEDLFKKTVNDLLKQIDDLDASTNNPFGADSPHDYRSCYDQYKEDYQAVLELILKRARELAQQGDPDAVYHAGVQYGGQISRIANRLQQCLKAPKPKRTNKSLGGLR